jgi:hypothetical protein
VAVITNGCNGSGMGDMRRPAVMFALTLAVGEYALLHGKTRSRAGGVRPVAAVRRRGGRKPTGRKKTPAWTPVFFSTLRPPAMGRGLSLPL